MMEAEALKRLKKFYITIVIIATIGAMMINYPKKLFPLVNKPYSATSCLIICDNITAQENITLVSEGIKQLINKCNGVNIKYSERYHDLDMDSDEPVYRLFFWDNHKELGALIINGGFVYDRSSRYKIEKDKLDVVTSLLSTYFADKMVE